MSRDDPRMTRAERRRWLYANDPIWRLTKLKDNRERRLRRKLHRRGSNDR